MANYKSRNNHTLLCDQERQDQMRVMELSLITEIAMVSRQLQELGDIKQVCGQTRSPTHTFPHFNNPLTHSHTYSPTHSLPRSLTL